MKYACSLSLLLIVFLTVNCEKDIPSKSLPPITQEGKNTAGFLLDGEVWVPFAKCTYFGNRCEEISAFYGPPYGNKNMFSIQLFRENDDRNEYGSYITITGQTPIYKAGDHSKEVNASFASEEWSGNSGDYIYNGGSSGSEGKFIFTRLDTINNVMSGTFNFILRESNGSGKTIEITDGRFDLYMQII
jgi:hypothetical protein